MTGESIAVFEDEEIADALNKGIKTALGGKDWPPTIPTTGSFTTTARWMMIKTLTLQVVQLVILEFLPPDKKQNRRIILACEENDDALLEQQLNKPRSPNFQDANQITPLYAAAVSGSLKCVLLLLEAGANKDQGRTDTGSTPLFIAAFQGAP